MRAPDMLRVAGGAVEKAVKRAGERVAGALGKVNPDVWRELAFASVAAPSVLFPRRESIEALEEDEFPPVVLVHGLASNRGTWWPLRLFLRMNGHRRIYAFGYEQGTIEEHAAELAAFVEEVRQVTGVQRTDIIAHSMGGIVARYAIQRLELAPVVRTLVTLATPHRGTWAAQYANTPLTRALRPDSTFLKDLNQDDLSSYPVRFVSISSNRDVYVVPSEAMTLPHAENLFVPDISHTEHIFSLHVFRLVVSRLPPEPGPEPWISHVQRARALRHGSARSPDESFL